MNRRGFLATGMAFSAAQAVGANEHQHEKEEVAPGEDLMREHGVLRRVMFLYDEAIRRIEAAGPLPAVPIAAGAKIIRRVIEDYHEKLEEEFLFPRFEKAGKLTGLVATLRTQHQAGRTLTDAIVKIASGPMRVEGDKRDLR